MHPGAAFLRDEQVLFPLLLALEIQFRFRQPAHRADLHPANPNAHFEFRGFKNQIEESLQPERLMASLSSGFGILAGTLSAVGLHSLISYLVARRRNEIGIRMGLARAAATSLLWC